jgi:hypothetical protein
MISNPAAISLPVFRGKETLHATLPTSCITGNATWAERHDHLLSMMR